MTPRFSLVYPTRDRPKFIQQALRILETQRHANFQVVVSDNYLDPALSCEQICRDSGLANLSYVRPPRPVGMVENWNHALQFATGEYVCYLTDKMFVLPDALAHVERAIHAARGPDIVSWTSDAFTPASYADYFGDGSYVGVPSNPRTRLYRRYPPRRELSRRGRGEVARGEQSLSDYSRGKLVFGAYRRELLDRMVKRFGAPFHSISPDYTSMVLGLSEARDAIELPVSCVVSVNTDISNGMLADTDDSAALAFLGSLAGGTDGILPNLLVPGLYASLHNWVAHDYLTLKREFGLRFRFNIANWLVYCREDIYRPGRRWSDPRVEAEQKQILATFLESLEPRVAAAVQARIAARAAPKPPQRSLRGLLQPRQPRLTESRSSSIQAAVESLVAGRDWAGVRRS
jgi:glycosyltransferase involved in cell wall biosynthesis